MNIDDQLLELADLMDGWDLDPEDFISAVNAQYQLTQSDLTDYLPPLSPYTTLRF